MWCEQHEVVRITPLVFFRVIPETHKFERMFARIVVDTEEVVQIMHVEI